MRILIVDDDRTLSDLLAFTMRRAGFEPCLAYSAGQAMDVFKEIDVGLVLLDVNMPGEPGIRDGFDVCRQIREASDVPIILLTVRDDEDDVVKGLNLGADDYVLKPFSPRQLVARVNTVLRRTTAGRMDHKAPYVFQEISFNPDLRTFSRGTRETITLTRLEARLLDNLMLNQGHVIPSGTLIAHVWGPGGGSEEMLRQLIHRLRGKIEIDPAQPELIENAPGIGYGFGL